MQRSLKFADHMSFGYPTKKAGKMKWLAVAFCIISTVLAWITVFGLAFMLK